MPVRRPSDTLKRNRPRRFFLASGPWLSGSPSGADAEHPPLGLVGHERRHDLRDDLPRREDEPLGQRLAAGSANSPSGS